MLAEIFIVRLEAQRRLVEQALPSSTSRFIPFGRKTQSGLKEAERKGVEAPSEEPRLGVARLETSGTGLKSKLSKPLSRPHTLFHEAVLGRTVKRLAFRAHCLACAGVPFALLHEAHLSSAVKRLAVRAHRLAVAGLSRSRTDREAGQIGRAHV